LRFYLATDQSGEAKKAAALGFVHGLFIPRKEVLRAGRDYAALVTELAAPHFSWIGIESSELDAKGMVDEARRVAKAAAVRLTCLMPMSLESVRALALATAEADILGGVQYVCSQAQAIIAARAGASCIVMDAAVLGGADIEIAALVSHTKSIFSAGGLDTAILVSAVSTAADIARVAAAGADGVICDWAALQSAAYHPSTDATIVRRLSEWQPERV